MAAGGREARSTDPGYPLTVLSLALIVVVTAVSSVTVSSGRWDVARVEAQAAAERAAVKVGAEMATAVSAVDAASRSPGEALPATPRPDWLPVIAYVSVDGSGPDDAELAALADQPSVRVALARARDSGALVMSAPTASTPATTVIVRALYRGDGQISNEPSRPTTAVRRSEHVGHVLAIVDADALLEASDLEGVRLSDGTAVLGGAGEAPDDGMQAVVPVLDRRWQMTTAIRPPSTSLVWFLVVSGLVVAAAVALASRSWRVAAARNRADADRARDRAEAVISYAGVVQESHDLGQVVPALAVQLGDRLGLAGISLRIAGDDGRRREIFAHGDVPHRATEVGAQLPAAAEAGETVAVHLRRAERPIGELHIRCGRPMGPDDFDQLRIVCELITSTIVSARSAEQQQDAVTRLRTLDELKTSFLGTASHELRTPVTAIAGFARMLSDRWDSLTEENRRVFADRIAANARVLEALVQDLLDFARLERGELKLVLEAVDASATANRVLDRLEPVWSTHTVERAITPGAVVTGDAAALERIVTNLVSNAVKFSPEGSTVVVTVDGGDRVRLTVDDAGPGVPDGERDRIFVRFFRGADDAVVRTHGVGIGLSVVQDYVGQMGGAIHVERSPAGGARFVVELDRPVDETPREEERSDATT